MCHMSETQVELMHRIADAQADTYVSHEMHDKYILQNPVY